jgi:hypothetical protein
MGLFTTVLLAGKAGAAPWRLPDDLVQYVRVHENNLEALPYSVYAKKAGPATTVTFNHPRGHLKNFEIIRIQYGGTYPFTVVKSSQPFVITSQEDDVLIVGLPGERLERRYVPNDLPSSNNRTLSPHPAFSEKLKVIPILPPGVPDGILREQKIYRRGEENDWIPNPRQTTFRGRVTTDHGEFIHYQVFLK